MSEIAIIALAIAKHFRGDKQPAMDDQQAIALFIPVAKHVLSALRAYEGGWVPNPNATVQTLEDFVLSYRKTYMETQTHPTAMQENWLAMKARAICDDYNFGETK